MKGDWPKQEYFRLLRLQLALLQALGQLGQALVRLEPKWRKRIVQETAFLNQPLVSLLSTCRRLQKLTFSPLLQIADVATTFSIVSLGRRKRLQLCTAD